MNKETVIVNVSLSGSLPHEEMVHANRGRFTFTTFKAFEAKQLSLPGSITLLFSNGTCSGTDSTNIEGNHSI